MSKSRPTEEILAAWDVFVRPKDGETYQHYKGGTYTIIATGFMEDTEAPCVVYQSNERHTIWVRTAKNFLEEIEHGGQKMPRFTKI